MFRNLVSQFFRIVRRFVLRPLWNIVVDFYLLIAGLIDGLIRFILNLPKLLVAFVIGFGKFLWHLPGSIYRFVLSLPGFTVWFLTHLWRDFSRWLRQFIRSIEQLLRTYLDWVFIILRFLFIGLPTFVVHSLIRLPKTVANIVPAVSRSIQSRRAAPNYRPFKVWIKAFPSDVLVWIKAMPKASVRALNRLTLQSKELRRLKLSSGTQVLEPFSKTPLIVYVLLIMGFLSWQATNVNLSNLISRFGNLSVILERMANPRFEYRDRAISPMIDTIQMSFLGSLVGALLALPVAFLSAGNITKNKFVLSTTRFLLSLVRTLPVLIYASIMTLAFGYGVFAGTLAITIFTFGILSKMLYENIETIDLGPFMAIEATGATKMQAFSTAVMPQILPSYLSYSLYSFEINIRFAAILGYVGAGGIGLLFDDRMAWRRYEDVGLLVLMLFVVVFTIENVSRALRRRLT